MARDSISVDYLARVEGEGALHVELAGDEVAEVRFKIFEPPRMFEAFLRGRRFTEAPDITSRICGICPIAYQMSAVHAMENALGITVDGPLRELRRLAYCGEWIESHILHIYMLHAPDFLGYPDAIRMAEDLPEIVERGLRLKKAGNEIIKLLGGRSIHPVNVKVGGFYRAPSKPELESLAETLAWAREAALKTVRWAGTLPFPDFQRDYEFLALSHPEEYPMNEGRLVSSNGLEFSAEDFENMVEEEQVPHSNALHAVLRGRGAYVVGPLARYNLNRDRLAPIARKAAEDAGLGAECRNPFQSIVVRSVEVLHACDEALRIISGYEPPERPALEVEPRAATGYGATEAPRGLLYHRYDLDDAGGILEARIIPPTSQNQKSIEGDLRRFVSKNLSLPREELVRRCEQVVRNYDPCISCATHSLKVRFESFDVGARQSVFGETV